jgi:hypothetical protein
MTLKDYKHYTVTLKDREKAQYLQATSMPYPLNTVPLLRRIRPQRNLLNQLDRVRQQQNARNRNQPTRRNHIVQIQPLRRIQVTNALVNPAQIRRPLMRQRIHKQRVSQRMKQHARMSIEASSDPPRTNALHFVIRHAYAPRIVDESRRDSTLLRLHNLVIKSRVNRRRGNVCRIPTIASQRLNEVARHFLTDDTGRARIQSLSIIRGKTQRVCENRAFEIWANGEQVLDDFARRGPVLEGPLCGETALGPRHHGDVFVGVADRGYVVDGVGDVLGVC